MLRWVLPLLAAVALAFVCVRTHMQAIPPKLLDASSTRLKDAGISAGGLRFDGRDAILRGVAGSLEVSQKAQDAVASVWGVRSVRTELIEPAPPPAVPAEAQKQITEAIKLRGVEFETGKASLTAGGRSILDGVAAILLQHSAVNVEIVGHTDNRGDSGMNQKLSEERAQAVKAYLISKGIAAGRMGTVGYGQTRPVATNDTEEGRRSNRRIEFLVKE
jgi:outer membrane protein OmpA-like peptidoglycan-associated protein